MGILPDILRKKFVEVTADAERGGAEHNLIITADQHIGYKIMILQECIRNSSSSSEISGITGKIIVVDSRNHLRKGFLYQKMIGSGRERIKLVG